MLIVLDSSLGQDQIFSENIVEDKRQGRNLVAVLNGMSIAAATKAGMLEQKSMFPSAKAFSNKSSMFLSQDAEDDEADEPEEESQQPLLNQPAAQLNPLASAFTPGAFKPSTAAEPVKQPSWMNGFGQTRSNDSPFSAPPTKDIFKTGQSVSAAAPAQPTSQSLGAAQKTPSQTFNPVKFGTTPSLQPNDENLSDPAAKSPFVSQGNPFAAQPNTGSLGTFPSVPKAKEKAISPPPQEEQAASSTKTHDTFSWSPAPQAEGVFQTSQSSLEIPKPPQSQIKLPTFGCKS